MFENNTSVSIHVRGGTANRCAWDWKTGQTVCDGYKNMVILISESRTGSLEEINSIESIESPKNVLVMFDFLLTSSNRRKLVV